MSILITLNSNNDAVNNSRSNLRYIPQPSIVLHPNKQYGIQLQRAKILFTIFNITTGVNDTFRYSMDNIPTWKVITLPTGCYDLRLFQSAIRYYLKQNGDYTPDSGGNSALDIPFSLFFNESTGKSYFIVDLVSRHLDLGNNLATTFYEIFGFLVSDTNLSGTTSYISTNQVSLQNNFSISCNLGKSYRSQNPVNGILYADSWRVNPFQLQEINQERTSLIQLKDGLNVLREVEVQIKDSSGAFFTFSGPSTDSNTEISLIIKEI